MAPKRYFFVHLAIFAGLCSTFAIAGFSSYQEFLRMTEVSAREAGRAPAGTLSETGVLALSGTTMTK